MFQYISLPKNFIWSKDKPGDDGDGNDYDVNYVDLNLNH